MGGNECFRWVHSHRDGYIGADRTKFTNCGIGNFCVGTDIAVITQGRICQSAAVANFIETSKIAMHNFDLATEHESLMTTL